MGPDTIENYFFNYVTKEIEVQNWSIAFMLSLDNNKCDVRYFQNVWVGAGFQTQIAICLMENEIFAIHAQNIVVYVWLLELLM